MAFLIPPKLRQKGRFQSISKLGEWGDKMLEIFAVKGCAKKNSLLARFRIALPGFSQLRPFIKRFAQAATITSQAMKLLKTKGLNQTTYQQCLTLAAKLPKRSPLKKRFNQYTWADQN